MAQAQYAEKSVEKRHPIVRRSAFEVRMAVLKATADGCTKPTQIMYRSNTSWTVLQENLESLVESGLLRRGLDQSRMEYAITERGCAVVRDYLNLIELAKA